MLEHNIRGCYLDEGARARPFNPLRPCSMARTRGGFRPNLCITRQGGKIRRMNGRFYQQPASLSFSSSMILAGKWQRAVTASVEMEIQECVRSMVNQVHQQIENDCVEGSYSR